MYKTLAIICLLLFSLSIVAQNAAPAEPNKPLVFPPGMKIPVVLQNTLEAKKAKVGDVVKLEIGSAIKSKDGKILIPGNAKLFGKVTEAQGSTKQNPESHIAILVEKMEWKDGSMPLHAVFSIMPLRKGGGGGASISGLGSRGQDAPGASAMGNDAPPDPLGETEVVKSTAPEIGTILVSKTRNIALPPGTRFSIEQIEVKQAEAKPAAPAQPTVAK